MSLQAYQKAQRTLSNPRDNEYRIFAQVTSGLQSVVGLPRTDARVIDALTKNRKLWSALSSDCGSSDNKLPKTLRAQIISIGLWVNRHTSEVIRSGADIEALVDINKTIMEGLALQRANQQAAAAQGAATAPAKTAASSHA